MKPIKLVMNAFGSFLDKTEINFNILNNAGFYLITGPTGSGKTTIFDAIVFALYGEASGDTRSTEGFRSDFADDKNETYVEFTFEKDFVTYTIRRTPRYSVSYRTTPVESKVSLVFKDTVIEKIANVNEAINQIIGLSSSQFKQVIMLAQGEFMKLIHAKSFERDEIFRKIFGTEVFEKVSRLLKEETKAVKDKLKLTEELMKRYIINIPDVKNYVNYNPTLQDLNNADYLIKELSDNISDNKKTLNIYEKDLKENSNELINLNANKETAKLINDDFNTLKEELNKLDILDKEKSKISLKEKEIVILNKVSKIKPFYDKLININLQINLLSKTYQTNNAILEEKQETLNFFIDQTNMIELDRLSLENLKKTKEEIEKNINIKKEIEAKLIIITTLNEQIGSLNKELGKLNSNELVIKDEITALNDEIKELSKYQTEYEITSNEIKALESKIKEFNKNNVLYKEVESVLKEINDLSTIYQELLNDYNLAHTNYFEKEKSYFNNIAGMLANELTSGNPCPVCGSIHHPLKAVITTDIVSKETLDKEADALELMRTKKDEKLVEIESLKAKYDACINQLLNNLEIKSKDDILSKINEKTTNYNNSLNELNIYLNTCLKNIKELKNKEKELFDKEELYNTNNTIILNLSEKLTNINNSLSNMKGVVSALEEQLTFSNDIEELTVALEERKEAMLMLEEAIKGFDLEYNQVKEEYQIIKGKTEENINQLENLKEEQDKAINAYNEALINENIDKFIIDNIEMYISELASLSTYVKEVTEFTSNYTITVNKITVLKDKLKDTTEQNLEELDNLISVKEKQIEKLKVLITNITNIINSQQTIFNDLLVSFQEYKKILDLHVDLSTMSLAANGQNKKYLSFERYVLTEYFDNILNHANIRLKKMTNGRYLLYRKVDKSKGRAQQGLDMEIFDFETGKRRDVKTLSGGETFKAALSLALGLADAIENKVGNVTIDTLFIDEGFGTLDEESLNQAISILLELNNDNKSIGIISHVQELKDLIPTKLIVSKIDNGSVVKIVD